MIIGFAHKKRVGKDTAGDYLVKKYHFNKMGFAKALYDECKRLHIVMPKEINDNSLVCFGFLGNPFFLKLKVTEIPKVTEFIDWVNKGINETKVWRMEKDFQYYEGMIEKDRWLLQWWGTDIRRDLFSKSYWLDRLFENIEHDKDYVITDVRFTNEANSIIEKGGFVYRIDRPGLLIDGTENHASEIDLDGYLSFTGNLENNSTIEDFYSKLDDVISFLRTD